MKLTSNWSQGTLFWRTFTKDDTVYIIGLKEGFLAPGETAEYNHPAGVFQMEVKREGLFGQTLIAAGQVFTNDDELLITDSGQLIGIEDAAHVVVDPGFKFEFYGTVTQFLSAGSTDTTIKITSSLTQTTSSTHGQQTTLKSEATNETTLQGQVELQGKEMILGVTPKGTFTWNDKVIRKIERVVATTLNVQVATNTSYSEEQSITLKAGKLTAITSSWQRRFVTGSVTIGQATIPYDATLGYITSRHITEYASPDALPPELRVEYNKQFGSLPNLVNGQVLRETSSATVYVIFGGAKFHIPSPDVLQQLYGGWGNVMIVADNALANVPTTPRDGTILIEDNDAHVWLIEGGKRRHLTTPLVLNQFGGWSAVHKVPKGATAGFPLGEPVV